MKTAAQVLREARELISDPERWAQGAWAKNAPGHSVQTRAPEAVSWCAAGAIYRCAGNSDLSIDTRELLYDVIGSNISPDSGHVIAEFNDTHTHAEVLEMFDRAIALAEERQL